MKELVVISGKGGTGKTSIMASFAALAQDAVLADCDVDAADLHLILEPSVVRRELFSGGSRARVEADLCSGCGKCVEVCRFDAMSMAGTSGHAARVDTIACEGCGVCAWFCPETAIALEPAVNGEWYVSATRYGPMIHARLGIAEENSGKLVSLVRREARKVAETRGRGLILADGSPGTGCPVIASITGADLVLIVTEPTVSGLHDLGRVADLTRHFGVSAMVCINKWDLNPGAAGGIESWARDNGLGTAGRVAYDRAFTDAQKRRQSVVEYRDNGCAQAIREVWSRVYAKLTAGE